jgi:hypothetical protein
VHAAPQRVAVHVEGDVHAVPGDVLGGHHGAVELSLDDVVGLDVQGLAQGAAVLAHDAVQQLGVADGAGDGCVVVDHEVEVEVLLLAPGDDDARGSGPVAGQPRVGQVPGG